MARVIYHRLIRWDLRSALNYYEAEGTTQLADRFFADVEATIRAIEQNPTGHHFSDGGHRGVSLGSFPYHFLFDVDAETILIAVLRHDRRHPKFGLRRRKPGEFT